MMRTITNFETQMRLAFGLAFAIVFSTIGVSLFVISKLNTNSGWVSHTHEVIAGVNAVHVQFGNARVSTKNYLLTHQMRHLAPRISAFQSISEGMGNLKSLTADNPRQEVNIDDATSALKEYETLTSQMISEFDTANGVGRDKFAEWTDKTEPSGRKVAACLVRMRQEEERLLVTRVETATSFVNQAYSIMPFMLALQVAVTAYIYYVVLNQCEASVS